MAYKARPILKVRFLNVKYQGLWRVLIKSRLTYKGQPVSYDQAVDWWGGVPQVCLSKSTPSGCPTGILDLGKHNSHLDVFDRKSDGDAYIRRVKSQLEELMKVWPSDPLGLLDTMTGPPTTDTKKKTAMEATLWSPKLTGYSYIYNLGPQGLDKSSSKVYNEKEEPVVQSKTKKWGCKNPACSLCYPLPAE